MAKIPRVIHKIFGSTALLTNMGEFGSLAAAAPVNTTDPTTIQSLSAWLGGWASAILGSNAPALEDMNGFCFVHSYQIGYIFQAGIPEWQTAAIYYIGSMVNSSGTIYVSITDSNSGNAVTDTTKWKVLGNGIRTTTGTDTATATDDVILADATAASFTQTLPTLASYLGRKLTVKVINTNGFQVTLKGNGSELIDFANTSAPLNSGDNVTMIATASAWYII